jgi:hypothetical protein
MFPEIFLNEQKNEDRKKHAVESFIAAVRNLLQYFQLTLMKAKTDPDYFRYILDHHLYEFLKVIKHCEIETSHTSPGEFRVSICRTVKEKKHEDSRISKPLFELLFFADSKVEKGDLYRNFFKEYIQFTLDFIFAVQHNKYIYLQITNFLYYLMLGEGLLYGYTNWSLEKIRHKLLKPFQRKKIIENANWNKVLLKPFLKTIRKLELSIKSLQIHSYYQSIIKDLFNVELQETEKQKQERRQYVNDRNEERDRRYQQYRLKKKTVRDNILAQKQRQRAAKESKQENERKALEQALNRTRAQRYARLLALQKEQRQELRRTQKKKPLNAPVLMDRDYSY